MRKRISILLILIMGAGILSVLLGCGDDENPVKNTVITRDYVYPLGNLGIWHYIGISYKTNFKPNSLANILSDTMFYNISVEIASLDTLFDSIEVFHLKETLIREMGDNVDTFITDAYFNNTDSGLYYYGYSGVFSSVVLPKANFRNNFGYTSRPLLLDQGMLKKTDEYYDPPWLVLKYPLATESQWTIRDSTYFRIDKKIKGFIRTEVPHGFFQSFEVKWFWDMNEDGRWDEDIERYDYFCEYGLVMRTTSYKNIGYTNEHGQFLGTCDEYEEIKLTAVWLLPPPGE